LVGQGRERVCLDANVIISGLISDSGTSAGAVDTVLNLTVTGLYSRDTESEFFNTLIDLVTYLRLRGIEPQDVANAFADYRLASELIEAGRSLIECRDPKDEIYLACATDGSATVLVTWDQDLLVLADQTTFQILNPGQYLAYLQGAGLIA
jgi:putative PIN family toxin of toxin-antitoxin system